MSNVMKDFDPSGVRERLRQGIRLDPSNGGLKFTALHPTAEQKAERASAEAEYQTRTAEVRRASEELHRNTGNQENKVIGLPNITSLNIVTANTVKGMVEVMIQNKEDAGMEVNANYGDKHSESLSQYLSWINEYIDNEAATYQDPNSAIGQKK